MSTHNLCFRAKIRKIMYTPVNPNFIIIKWGVSGVGVGSTLHRRVCMIQQCAVCLFVLMHNVPVNNFSVMSG